MTKVLFVGHMGIRGGAQAVMQRLMVGLQQHDIEPVALFPEDGPATAEARDAGIKTYISPVQCWMFLHGESDKSNAFSRYLGGFEQRVQKLEEIIENESVDVVVTNTSVIAEAAVAACRKQRPHVWYVHEQFSHNEFIQRSGMLELVRPLMELADSRIVGVSDAVVSELRAAIPGVVVDCIHNGIDAGIFTGGGGSPEVKAACFECRAESQVVLYVGDLSRRKGVDLLFEAARQVLPAHPDVRLCLAGREHECRIEEMTADWPEELKERVIFLGFRDPTQLYLNADLLIVPSRGDPFPLVVLEGMAAGLPVIGTRSGGMEEQIVDGETGWLVPAGDAEALGTAMADALSDMENTRARGHKGAERAAGMFGEAGMLGAVSKLLAEMCAQGRAPLPEASAFTSALMSACRIFEEEHNHREARLEGELARLRGVEREFRQLLDRWPFRLRRALLRWLPSKK